MSFYSGFSHGVGTARYARPTWLDLAHRRLDEAVFAAYGWPADLFRMKTSLPGCWN